MPLLLIRHGRSSYRGDGTLMDRAAMARWLASYDQAGILEHDAPPAALRASIAHARVLAASDMPRAVESARSLSGGTGVTIDPLFREIPLPIPTWFSLRAPLSVWAALIHLQWGLDIARSRDASRDAIERVREAARWCRESCAGGSSTDVVAVVTHGVFRRLLAQRLVTEGWRRQPGRRSYAHWSVWSFDAPPAGQR